VIDGLPETYATRALAGRHGNVFMKYRYVRVVIRVIQGGERDGVGIGPLRANDEL